MDLDPAQLKTYEVVQRIRMAWTALIVVLALFAVGFFVFLWLLFRVPGFQVTKILVAGIDSMLGYGVKRIFDNLFPAPQAR